MNQGIIYKGEKIVKIGDYFMVYGLLFKSLKKAKIAIDTTKSNKLNGIY